jgi:acetyl-CoA synthetase
VLQETVCFRRLRTSSSRPTSRAWRRIRPCATRPSAPRRFKELARKTWPGRSPSPDADDRRRQFYRWFHDGELNASYNRQPAPKTQGDKTAIIFEADDGKVTRITTSSSTTRSQFANALKGLGVKQGERVLIYMPMSIEVVVAMQACAHRRDALGGVRRLLGEERAGARHRRRRQALITADGQMRGGKEIR